MSEFNTAPFDFESQVNRRDTGNMKGRWAEHLPEDMILLAGAEMDYALPDFLCSRIADFAKNGIFGYTLADDPYRGAVCDWIRMTRGAEIRPDWIVPTLGTIFGLSTAVRAFTEPGQGVIVHHPSYYRFDVAIEANGRRVTVAELFDRGDHYELDFADLEKKMADPGNRMLLLCNPHNPTGMALQKKELLKIRDLAAKYDVTVFSDEIFAEMTFTAEPLPVYALLDPEHGISSTSLGKSFNLTGVNQANLMIPSEAMRSRYLEQRDRDHFGSIDPFFYNLLLAAYTPQGLEWIKANRLQVQKNHRILSDALEDTPLKVYHADGTFVAWIDCRALGLSDSDKNPQLTTFFEEHARVSADPGHEYGPEGSGFLRVNIASPSGAIRRAAGNMRDAVRNI